MGGMKRLKMEKLNREMPINEETKINRKNKIWIMSDKLIYYFKYFTVNMIFKSNVVFK